METSWAQRLKAARSDDEVVSVAQDYVVARCGDIAYLPAECRPNGLKDPVAIAEYAYLLASYHGHGDASRLVQHIAAFFSAATMRLSQLRSLGDDGKRANAA